MRLWHQKFVPLRQAFLFISFRDIQAPIHHHHKHIVSRGRLEASLRVHSVANSCPSGFAGSANTQGNTTVVNSSPTYKTTIRQLEDNYKATHKTTYDTTSQNVFLVRENKNHQARAVPKGRVTLESTNEVCGRDCENLRKVQLSYSCLIVVL